MAVRVRSPCAALREQGKGVYTNSDKNEEGKKKEAIVECIQICIYILDAVDRPAVLDLQIPQGQGMTSVYKPCPFHAYDVHTHTLHVLSSISLAFFIR